MMYQKSFGTFIIALGDVSGVRRNELKLKTKTEFIVQKSTKYKFAYMYSKAVAKCLD